VTVVHAVWLPTFTVLTPRAHIRRIDGVVSSLMLIKVGRDCQSCVAHSPNGHDIGGDVLALRL
jgi:hypothetical protein